MTTKRQLIRKKVTQYNLGGLKRLYENGGSQYDNNTVTAAGQGGDPSTTIINVESNPDLLQQREAAFENLKNTEVQRLNQVTETIQNQQLVGEQNIQQAADAANAQVESYAGTVKSAADKLNESGILNKASTTTPTVTPKVTPGVTSKAAVPVKMDPNQLVNQPVATSAPTAGMGQPLQVPGAGTTPQISPGVTPPKPGTDPALKGLTTASKTADTATTTYDLSKATVDGSTKAQGVGAAIKAYKAQRATNQAIKAGATMSSAGTAAGAGWSALGSAGKANVIGAAASLAGEGIKKWSSDDDETTVNFGEGTGAALSGAGAGMGAAATAGAIYGTSLGPVGTAVGAGIGALYGIGKAIYARNKARKAKRKMEQAIVASKTKYNKELGDKYAQQKGMLLGVQTRMKETSGYDTGSASVARFGGPRLRRIAA
jgi:hypothetical protein